MRKRIAALLCALIVLLLTVSAFTAQASGGVSLSSREPCAAETASKKKKKKNTATPPAAVTPAPELAGEDGEDGEPDGPITDPQAIADYLFTWGELPENFITKKDARAAGWDPAANYLSDVLPGMSIGGDYFGNFEGRLPRGSGLSYHEADANYEGGRRGAERIIYSSDGRVWYTGDHYNTFTELFPSWE